MNPATKPTETNHPARICAWCPIAPPAPPGITLSGVSKTYRSRDGECRR